MAIDDIARENLPSERRRREREQQRKPSPPKERNPSDRPSKTVRERLSEDAPDRERPPVSAADLNIENASDLAGIASAVVTFL